MDKADRLTLDELDVTVAETADALTYTFTPRNPGPRPGFPLVLAALFVGLPLGILGLVGYALAITGANRPVWELALTGVFAVQLVGWLVLGTSTILGLMFRTWLRHGRSSTLVFTGTHVLHADVRVGELATVRGLRLFVYPVVIRYLADSPLPRTESPPDARLPPIPPDLAPIPPGERPPDTSEAGLSLVVGDEGGTHGLFGGFDPPVLRALADHIHHRLTAFRSNQGMMSPLDPLAVVETSSEEVERRMNTRPTRRIGGFAAGSGLVLQNRWAGTAWCVAMLAGLFASGRLIGAAGLGAGALVGHFVLGFLHFGLLLFHLGGHSRDGPGA